MLLIGTVQDNHNYHHGASGLPDYRKISTSSNNTITGATVLVDITITGAAKSHMSNNTTKYHYDKHNMLRMKKYNLPFCAILPLLL